MDEPSHQITDALLRVVVDPGHDGPFSEYRIDSDKDGYTVTLKISKSLAGPGRSSLPPPSPPSTKTRAFPAFTENRPNPSEMREVLAKNRQQVEAFLERLSAEFNVYRLADLKPSYPFLHPTFYTFSFRDSAGSSHSFQYQIECANHLDEQYRRLIQEFDSFFESERVFNIFFESR